MRITRPQMFMEIARVVAKRSTCMRLNVGAVIVHNRRIVSIGYNGVPPGAPHCTGNDCPGKHHCRLTKHAEENALEYLAEEIRGDLDIYVTDSPCEVCFTRLTIDPRIKRVFFGTPYRITEHLDHPPGSGPRVYRVLPAGYVMVWKTRELVVVET